MYILDYFKDPFASLSTLTIEGNENTEKEKLSEKEILILLNKTINSATTLIFNSCSMTEPVVNAVAKKVNLKEISFINCSGLTNEQVNKITSASQNSLEAFSVTGPSRLSEEIWNILSDVKTLHSVSLSDIPIQRRSDAHISFLKSKNEQIKQLCCKLFYPSTPADQKIALPNLEKFTWFHIKSSDLDFLSKTSPKLSVLETCDLTFTETLNKVRELLPRYSLLSFYKPQNISKPESPPVVGIKTKTTQINPASMDGEGFSYSIQPRKDKACLLKTKMSNGDESVIDASVPYLTDSDGVMCSVQGDKAIIVTPQQNKKNTGNTKVTVIDLGSNKAHTPITISENSTIYDVEINTFGGYAIEVNSPNIPWEVSLIIIHTFPLDENFQPKKISLQYYSPVQNQGCSSSTFMNPNEIALIAYGSGGSCVFCIDLVSGKILKTYVVPVNPSKINGSFTAITRVFDQKDYSLAVMDARGDIYVGPPSHSNQFVLAASMGPLFNNATFYTSFVYVGNGIFAFYAETQWPYLEDERIIGFFDINTQTKLSEIPVKVDGNCDFYTKRLRLLDSGKLGLTIVSRYLSDNKDTTWNYNFEFDIPKKN